MRESLQVGLLNLVKDYVAVIELEESAWERQTHRRWNNQGYVEDEFQTLKYHGFVKVNTTGIDESMIEVDKVLRELYPNYDTPRSISFAGTGWPLDLAIHRIAQLSWEGSGFRSFDPEIMSILVSEFLEYLASDEVEVEVLKPILHLRIESEAIKFEDGIEIRKIQPTDMDRLYPKSMFIEGLVNLPRCCISWRRKEQLLTHDFPSSKRPRFSRVSDQAYGPVIQALKILAKGSIRFDATNCYCLNRFATYGAVRVGNPNYELRMDCEISEAQEPFLKSLVARIKEGLDDSCGLAVDRLVESRNRGGRDKILDCVTAMESILLKKVFTEISYNFRLRYAALVEGADERLERLILAGAAYTVRSKISHGDTKSKDFKKALEVLQVESSSKASLKIYEMAKELVILRLFGDWFPGCSSDWDQLILGKRKPPKLTTLGASEVDPL